MATQLKHGVFNFLVGLLLPGIFFRKTFAVSSATLLCVKENFKSLFQKRVGNVFG